MSEKLTTIRESVILCLEVGNFASIEDALNDIKHYILENNLFEYGKIDEKLVVRLTILRPGAFE